jgi:hypothetical protein
MEQSVFNKLSDDCPALCSHSLHFKSPWEELKLVEQKVSEGMLLESIVEVALVTFALRVEVIRVLGEGTASMTFLGIKARNSGIMENEIRLKKDRNAHMHCDGDVNRSGVCCTIQHSRSLFAQPAVICVPPVS